MGKRLTVVQRGSLLCLLKGQSWLVGPVTAQSLLRRGLVQFAPIGVELTPKGRAEAERIAAKGGA